MKWTIFEKRSTTVSMVVWPWDRGKPVTKSIEMCDHGQRGMERGRRKPEGGHRLGTDLARRYIFFDVSGKGRAPEMLLNNKMGVAYAWVTEQA